MLRRLGSASVWRFGKGSPAIQCQQVCNSGQASFASTSDETRLQDSTEVPPPHHGIPADNSHVFRPAVHSGFRRTSSVFSRGNVGHASLISLHGGSQGLEHGKRGFASSSWFSGGKDISNKDESAAASETSALPGEEAASAASGLGGSAPADPVEFASAVSEALGQAEVVAKASAVDSSWYLTGKFIKGMCFVTETFGVPWWVSIAGVTAAVRLAIFPLMVWLEGTKIKMQKIQPQMDKLKEKYPGLYQGDKAAQEGFSRDTNALFKKHGMSPQSAMLMLPLSLSQVFIFGTFFFSLQNLCAAKLPSLMTGGTLWFPDLSLPDTTYLLPMAGAGLMLATVELNASDMGSSDQSGMMKSFMRVMSVAFLAMGGYLPSGMFVYFVTTNGFTLGQVAVMRSTAFRNLVGLPKMSTPSVAAPAQKQESFTEMYNRYLRQAEDMQKQSTGASNTHGSKLQGIKTFSVKQQSGRKRKGSSK